MRRLAYLPVLLFCAGVAFSQDVSLTLFDEIDDAAERRALREVWSAADPGRQQRLAIAFTEQFPASIALKEAYELAARTSVTLGDHERGLDWAQRSLRLLPENPFLLVMTADTAAKRRHFDLADRYARDALGYLSNAVPPSPIGPAGWPRIRDHLRATAYFVLGRVAAERADYPDARRSLLMSLTLNADDAEALYVLGVVEMATGRLDAAAPAFAHVMRSKSALAAAARESLLAIFAAGPSAASFDAYAASLTWTPPQAPARAPSPEAGEYAGSDACRECHTRVYESWRATGMARMFRPYRAEDVFGDFSGQATVSNGARASIAGSRHVFDIRQGDSGEWIRYPVDFIIGSKWQQAYATRLSDSRIAVFPVQYSRTQRSWLNYWSVVDGPNSERTDISRFHEVPAGAVYQTSCAPCHTSQLAERSAPTAGSSPSTDRHVFREGGINCEMCHGPSREHIARVKAGGTAQRTSLSTPVSFARLPAAQYAAICAQCHSQSAVHDVQANGAVNYSTQMPFYRAYDAHLPSNFSRKAFYRDGRHRATTFISEALARSECVRKGNATCGSCHNPHPPDAATNPTSLKFRGESNEMCVQCHNDLRESPERHTRHAPGTEASRCVSCHMPRIMDALLFPARTHEIDDIPDAEMTARFGQEYSPNACLGCHKDRNLQWLRLEIGKY